MEPQIITPPPVPLPPSDSSISSFHKSTLILVLAYLQIGFFVISILLGRSGFSLMPIIFLIPALLVIFTKNKKTYKTAKILLIIEYVFIPIVLFGFIFVLFHSHW